MSWCYPIPHNTVSSSKLFLYSPLFVKKVSPKIMRMPSQIVHEHRFCEQNNSGSAARPQVPKPEDRVLIECGQPGWASPHPSLREPGETSKPPQRGSGRTPRHWRVFCILWARWPVLELNFKYKSNWGIPANLRGCSRRTKGELGKGVVTTPNPRQFKRSYYTSTPCLEKVYRSTTNDNFSSPIPVN